MASGKFGYGLPKPKKIKRPRRNPMGTVQDYSPKARRQRARRQSRREFMQAPFGQGTLTGREAVDEARRAAGYKYGAADRMLGREIKGSAGQQRVIDVAYNLYGQKLGEIAAKTQAAYGQFQQAAYQQANQDTAQVQQGAVPGSELSGQVANAAAVRNANTVNFGGMLGAQGASQVAYTNAQQGIGELGRIGAHAQETKYKRELKAQRRDLKKERGQYRSETLRQIRDDERRWTLEKVAFELDKIKAAQDAALDRKQLKADKRENRLDRKDARREARQERREAARDDRLAERRLENDIQDDRADNQRDARADADGGSDGPSNVTPTQKRANRSEWQNALATARRIKSNDPKANVGDTVSYLVERGSVDLVMAKAAAAQVFRGGVRPNVRRKIRRLYPGANPKVRSGGGGGYGGLTKPISNPLDQFGK